MASNNHKREEAPVQDKENVNKDKCQHKVTIAINEEGHAGVYCVDCDEQLEGEC